MTSFFPRFFFLFNLIWIFFCTDITAFQIQSADSSSVDLRLVQESDLQAYQNDPDFNYEREIKDSDPWIFRFLEWIDRVLSKIFGNYYGDLSLRLFLIFLFVVALGLLLNALFKGNLSAAFTSKNASKKISIDLDNQHIDSVDLDAMLNKAIKDQNFRLAARYLYLKVLQSLNESEVINWTSDKTNHEYLSEISNSSIRSLFSKLTLYYDYTEYGDFDIDASRFEKMKDAYSRLLQKIEVKQ